MKTLIKEILSENDQNTGEDSKKNIKVLITGVAGLIGSHFSEYLIKKGYTVIGIDNLSGGYRDFINPEVIFYKKDLLNSDAIDWIFRKHKPDYVYHFAAYAAEGLSPFIRNFNYANNLICSVNVINSCIKYNVKKIVFTSSMAVYGHGEAPFRETQIPNPADPYGIAKYAVEMDLKQAYEQFGLKYSIVRPHNVIGTNQNIWDRYRNVIGIWIRQILKGNQITVFGDGSQKRAFSDVMYILKPLENLMGLGDCEIFNIGSDKEYEIKEIAQLTKEIGEKFGYCPKIEHLEARNEVIDAFCNHNKAKLILGFEDHTNIYSSVTRMFSWAKDQPERKVRNMKYEVEKNIYGYWK